MPKQHLLGIFKGEGIGPELADAAIRVLGALEQSCDYEQQFRIKEGGAIGYQSIARTGQPLDDIEAALAGRYRWPLAGGSRGLT